MVIKLFDTQKEKLASSLLDKLYLFEIKLKEMEMLADNIRNIKRQIDDISQTLETCNAINSPVIKKEKPMINSLLCVESYIS